MLEEKLQEVMVTRARHIEVLSAAFLNRTPAPAPDQKPNDTGA